MIVHVSLTEEHIRKGCDSRHGGSCPMYWAISEALGIPSLHVTSRSVDVTTIRKGIRTLRDYSLPEIAKKWVGRWDDSFRGMDCKPSPIEFDLEIEDVQS